MFNNKNMVKEDPYLLPVFYKFKFVYIFHNI